MRAVSRAQRKTQNPLRFWLNFNFVAKEPNILLKRTDFQRVLRTEGISYSQVAPCIRRAQKGDDSSFPEAGSCRFRPHVPFPPRLSTETKREGPAKRSPSLFGLWRRLSCPGIEMKAVRTADEIGDDSGVFIRNFFMDIGRYLCYQALPGC